MAKNISFSWTTEQFRNRTKDVTRRLGWWTLKRGEILCVVEKRMGLKKGEKVNRLGMIEVVSAKNEPLDHITPEEVAREGFPGWTPARFVEFFCKAHRIPPYYQVRRIEFRHLEEADRG